MNTVINNFNVTGKINNLETVVTSNTVIVNPSLSIIKSVDKNIWSTGVLKYTVTLTNNTNASISASFKDTVNPNYANVIPNKVLVNGTAIPYTYNKITGLLEINNLIIMANESVIVTYLVSKKVNDVFVLNNTAYVNDTKSNTVKVTSILIRNCNNFTPK